MYFVKNKLVLGENPSNFSDLKTGNSSSQGIYFARVQHNRNSN